MQNRLIVREAYEFFKKLNAGQKNLWATFAAFSGITGPGGTGGVQAAFAGFITCSIINRAAGDGYPTVPGPPNPIVGPAFTDLTLLTETTIRATFNPSPIGAGKRIYLRQALPGPGFKRWDQANGYIAKFSPQNANSPFDFNLKFDHLTGWNGRYWLGLQNNFGGRSLETLFEI